MAEEAIAKDRGIVKAFLMSVEMERISTSLAKMITVANEQYEDLGNRSLVIQKSKKWIRFRDAVLLAEEIFTKPKNFMADKQGYVNRIIESGEPEIGKIAATIDFPEPELMHDARDTINEIIVAALKYNRRLLSAEELINLVKLLAAKFALHQDDSEEEKKGKQQILEALSKIEAIVQNNELATLTSYTREFAIWEHNLNRGVLYFIERIKEHAKQLEKSRVFNEMNNNEAVKNLRTYVQQAIFFAELYELTKSATKTANWTGEFTTPDGNTIVKMPFLGPKGFYNNLDMGKNFIGLVRYHYGNHLFANELARLKKELGEQPLKWALALHQFGKILREPKHQAEVIMAAMRALNDIFNNRIAELEKEQRRELAKQMHSVENVLKRLGEDIEKPKTKIKKLLQQRKKQLEKELTSWLARYETELIVLNDVSTKLIDEMAERAKQLNLKQAGERIEINNRISVEAYGRINELTGSISESDINPDRSQELYTRFATGLPDIAAIERSRLENVELVSKADIVSVEIIKALLKEMADAKQQIIGYEKLNTLRMQMNKALEMDNDMNNKGKDDAKNSLEIKSSEGISNPNLN